MIEYMIREDYFEWLYDGMCENRYSKNISYFYRFERIIPNIQNLKFRET